LLAVLLFVCPARVAAIPVSEYEQQIKNAIASLEALVTDEDEEGEIDDYENELTFAIGKVRAAFPPNQTVESDGQVYNVDNTWLHKALDELKQEANRSERIEQIVARLTALDTRLAERKEQTQTVESKDAAKKRLE